MSDLLARDLRSVVESVWSVTLGFELCDAVGTLAPPAESTWCGCVQIDGAWCGLVKLGMSEALARHAAAAMFETPVEALSSEELTDALGEIANMTGGGVKALLPGPSQLSLPTVITGADFSVVSPGGKVVWEVTLQAAGAPIRVQVIEARSRERVEGLRGLLRCGGEAP